MKLTTSYQREINRFCKSISAGDYNIKEVTAGALTQARAKLDPWAFKRLSAISLDTFYSEVDFNKWHGMRLLAVDGSIINLPHSKSVVEDFGKESYIRKAGSPKSLGRASLLYDVLNQLTLDAQLDGYRISERTLLERHLDKVTNEDLVLGDRNYGVTPVLHMLADKGAKFCIRVKAGTNARKEVQEFIASDRQEEVVFYTSARCVYKQMKMSEDTKPLKVRLVKVDIGNDEVEVLVTNLFDIEIFPVDLFKDLYFMRWQVEEAYKMLKLRMNLELFSGKTSRSIQQDFHAKIFMMNLCATMSYPIAEKVKREFKASKRKNKYDQQINKTQALAQTKESIIEIFIHGFYQSVIDVLDDIVEKSRTVIRPNRKNKRPAKVKPRKPSNYKPL